MTRQRSRWATLLAVACGLGAGCDGGGAVVETSGTGVTTLKYLPPGARFQAAPPVAEIASAQGLVEDGVEAANAGPRIRVFYPRPGQSADGQCWQGLMIDRANNLYPVAGGDIVRLGPTGRILNGEDDSNFFATGGNSIWAVLDEPRKRMFSANFNAARVARFREGAEFQVLIEGLDGVGEGGVALGRGPLAGSLFVTDGIGGSRVHRVTLRPLSEKVFARGPLFQSPDNIASAPDGTLYVVSVDRVPATLVKITPDGRASAFATAPTSDGRRMVVVDDHGIVHWSSTTGIDRFRPDGRRLKPLPGPNDQPLFENLQGAAFDSKGNLFVVENFGCKKIYKYTGL